MIQLADLPVPAVSLDPGGKITAVNSAAGRLLPLVEGMLLQDFVHPDSEVRIIDLLGSPMAATRLHLTGAGNDHFVDVIAAKATADVTNLFLIDASEAVALGRQIQGLQQPGKKLLNQLHTSNTSMMGYTDLIAVMLEEDEPLSGERLAVVQRYLKEISRAQESIDRLLKVARFGKRPDPTIVPLSRRQVVIVDDEPAITELLAELMQSLKHRVSVFADGSAALAFCLKNIDAIDLVIADSRMPGISGHALADSVHQARALLPVVLCAEENITIDPTRQLYHCRKPIDINDLIQMVAELI
ncbi:MAG: response regulator [Pseudomonadota bacterium]